MRAFSRWAEGVLARVVQTKQVNLALGGSHSNDVPDVFLGKTLPRCVLSLDQMSRNLVRACCSSTDCASLQQACDAIALSLPLFVLADDDESNDGKGFLDIPVLLLVFVAPPHSFTRFSWCRRGYAESSFGTAHRHLVLAVLLRARNGDLVV